MSANFGGGGNSQEVDLNITPIIDCFTVLITFLLASASFLSIGFFEVATPGTTADQSSAEPDTEAVLKVKADHHAELKIKGKKNLVVSYDLTNKESLKNLNDEVQKLATEHLNIGQVLLSAEDDVDYKAVADVMSQLNDSKIPVVIGDF